MDESTLNDLLECSICLERLGSSSKVLPCQHTFCRKCLEVIVSSHSELRCPECRVLVDIKVEDLPPNVLLMRLLEGMKNATSAYQNQINNSSSMSATQSANDNNNPLEQQLLSLSSSTNVTTTTTLTQQPLQPTSLNQSNIADGQCQLNNQTNSAKSLGNFHSPRPNDDTNIMRQMHQQQQQQQQSRQSSHSVINQCHANNKQQLLPTPANSLPHAKALYDFLSKETGDLNFKKGDQIILHRRIDANWLIGECNGREGAFPMNHVQVITPLPFPQCKALYDFRMGPSEEEGCLTFKKGAIINVFRRVDQNWAEGRIGDCIGIFPIAFVEMNALAKQVMDVSAKYIHYAMTTRSVPPTPIAPPSAPLNCFSSDSSSTVTTSPNSSTSSSNTSSNSSTAPSSPISHQQSTATPASHSHTTADAKREKRYSLNALSTPANCGAVSAAHIGCRSQNRHSAELLTAPVPPPPNESAAKAPEKNQRSSSKATAIHDDAHNHTTKSAVNNSNLVSQHRHRHNSPAPPSLAASSSASNAFVALYPYRPQKSDELELKKGSVYYVTERCQDGWFKGTNRAQKSGVFPGNYVAPLRNNRSSGDATHHAMSAAPSASSSYGKRASGHFSTANGSAQMASHRNGNDPEMAHAPPELPPRSGVSGLATASSSSVWSKPLGQHVEAFFGRKSNQSASSQCKMDNNSNNSQSNSTTKKDSTTCSASSTTVNLIKRFTNMKRSKSPVNSTTAYSMDNPVFEDIAGATATPTVPTNKRNTIHLSHPVHVRSGSCPSQLLQSLPIDINSAVSSNGVSTSTNRNGDASGNSSYMFGSQRIKGHKERPTLVGMRNNIESNRHRNDTNAVHTNVAHHQSHHGQQYSKTSSHHSNTTNSSSSSHHRKSQSLDAVTISAQIGHNPSALAANKNKHNNVHKEKFRCIVSYPPNSEFELELQLGDIVWVHKKRDNGWYKGTHARTGKVGLFPSSFVEPDI